MIMDKQFVHLHVLSQYSFLQSTCVVDEIVKAAARYKMPAAALTDAGNLYGVMDFCEACKTTGVKPIIGNHMIVATPQTGDHDVSNAGFDLVLLAQNTEGYRNLLHLVNAIQLETTTVPGCITKELLANHSKGLIGLSGGMRGEIGQAFLA